MHGDNDVLLEQPLKDYPRALSLGSCKFNTIVKMNLKIFDFFQVKFNTQGLPCFKCLSLRGNVLVLCKFS